MSRDDPTPNGGWKHGQCGGIGSRRYCKDCERFVSREAFDEEHRDHHDVVAPTRSEPADFGGGESTGVQDL